MPVPSQSDVGATLRPRLRAALLTAMKSRDRLTTGVLRATLAAIENAEAVDTTSADRALAIEQTPLVGAAEAERRALTETHVEQIVRAEAAARQAAARDYDRAGKPERAEMLRTEARVLLTHLAGHAGHNSQEHPS
jgi:uncharacterized protein YqeY